MQAQIYSAQRYSFRVEQLWVNPHANESHYDDLNYDDGFYADADETPADRVGPGLNTNWIRIASELSPNQSPAPAGHPVVPAGWVLQMGAEGETDTLLADTRSGVLRYLPNMTQITVPYYSGGWPADPAIGQPGHTPPTQ